MKTVELVPIKMNNERTPGKKTNRFHKGTHPIQCILSALKKCKALNGIMCTEAGRCA